MLALDIRDVPVNIHLGTKPPFAAILFLHRHGPRGPEGLVERLNGPETFMPFRWDDRIHLVARTAISHLETSESPGVTSEIPEIHIEPTRLRVRMRSGVELVGAVRVLLPDNRNRLLDFLNLNDRFFPLTTDSGITVVGKDWIETVEPLAEET